MADAEVERVCKNLKDLIRCNSDLIGGVATQLEMLTKELDILRVNLKKYIWQKYREDSIDKSLLNKISDLVLEAEDSIETYIVYASRRKLRGSIDKAFHAVDYVLNLRRATKQIEEVTKRLQSIYQEKPTMSFQDLKIEDSPKDVQYRKKTLVLEEDNVVGFEDEVEKVSDLLTKESEELEVISIIGMHGLGKTTLAKKVLNDPLIEYEFYPRVFVNISPRYQKKEVFLSILGAFSQIDEEMHRMSDEELAEILWQKLQIRKYLVVMDDVWTPEAWDDLKVAFPGNRMNSRVIITSRYSRVALHANPKRDSLLHLRFLTPDESRELLRMKVFGKDSTLEEFEEYESHILQKCDGLPLAIVLIAGVLLNHRDRIDWWKKVANDLNDHAATDPEQSNSTALSFNHLPYQLKPCFLYLGIFPEGFEIPVSKLLLLWIAEGFVEPEGQKSLEDIAEDYLLELVGRSLVKVGRKRVNGQIKTCHISGTLLDFCKKEGMKENLFQEIRFDQTTSLQDSPSLNSYRRICINSHVLNYVSAKPSGQLVRSFLSFPKQETILPPEHVSTIPRAFSLLKVLDARSIIFTRFPVDLFYLILLKYIVISCELKILPVKMSYLRNLQTLIIVTSSRTLEIRADIWKMPLLRHLNTNASTFLA